MTVTTQNSLLSFCSNQSKYPANAEYALCRNICQANLGELSTLLSQGRIDPNYKLGNQVRVQRRVFEQGSSLLFLLVHGSIENPYCLDFYNLLKQLLSLNVDIENSPGGGFDSVINFACTNSQLLGEEILGLLLSAVPVDKCSGFLDLIEDPIKKQQVQSILLRQAAFSQLNDMNVSDSLLECCICNLLVTGNVGIVTGLLDLGLDPNYKIKNDCFINGIQCTSGMSLLLVVLTALVNNAGSSEEASTSASALMDTSVQEKNYCELVVLLLEKGASVTCSDGGVSPLQYVCQNHNNLSSTLVSCIFSLVTQSELESAVEGITNEDKKQGLKDRLDSLNLSFLPSLSEAADEMITDIPDFGSNVDLEEELCSMLDE